MQVGQNLRQVGTQTIPMSFECILREQRNHIDSELPGLFKYQLEFCLFGISLCNQSTFLLLPSRRIHRESFFSNDLASLNQPNPYFSICRPHLLAKEREDIFFTSFQCKAIETGVHERTTFLLHIENSVMRVILVNRIIFSNGELNFIIRTPSELRSPSDNSTLVCL